MQQPWDPLTPASLAVPYTHTSNKFIEQIQGSSWLIWSHRLKCRCKKSTACGGGFPRAKIRHRGTCGACQHARSGEENDGLVLPSTVLERVDGVEQEAGADGSCENIPQTLAKVEQSKGRERRRPVTRYGRAHARPHGRIAGAEEAIDDGEDTEKRELASQAPEGQDRDGRDGRRGQRQDVDGEAAVRQVAEAQLAQDLRDAHDGQQQRALRGRHAHGRRVRGQIQRREEIAQPLHQIRHRVDPEQRHAEEAPIRRRFWCWCWCCRARRVSSAAIEPVTGRSVSPPPAAAAAAPLIQRLPLLLLLLAVLQQWNQRTSAHGQADRDGPQRGREPEPLQQRLERQRHEHTREPRGAAQHAVRHAAPGDPEFIHHADDRVVEDGEANAVHDALREDDGAERARERTR